MIKHHASDCYLTLGCAPSLRLSDRILSLGDEPIAEDFVARLLQEIANDDQQDEFHSALELNFSIKWGEEARFRINVYRQQSNDAMVIRRIQTVIPTLEELGLPPVFARLIMQPRGLVLVVGQTGSGKSTSLAAMVVHRNRNGAGHIMTVEDPIEFVHRHDGCIISQRDVGIDTYSYGVALKNALRQRPDVVMIGEIRDRETMEHAVNFAETGHLCLSTLHANNANQAIERILNFFPEEKQSQVRLNLSLNLRGIISQRLVLNRKGTRSLATEVMLNTGLIKQLIEEGKVREIKPLMERGAGEGMMSFDQSLLKLWESGHIDTETAIAEADNESNMRLHIKQVETTLKLEGRTLPTGADHRPERGIRHGVQSPKDDPFEI